jgi:hypothetical protein
VGVLRHPDHDHRITVDGLLDLAHDLGAEGDHG